MDMLNFFRPLSQAFVFSLSMFLCSCDSNTVEESTEPVVKWVPPATTPITSGSVSVNINGGILQMTPEMFDFGQIGAGSTHDGIFTLKNIGQAPLTLASAVPSCACTTTNSIDGTVLKTGETLELKAALVAPLEPQEKTSKVFIRIEGSNDIVVAKLKGEVTFPINPSPAYASALKGVTDGVITLRSMDGKPFKILSSNGIAPEYVGFDPSAQAPQSRYVARWSIAGMECSTIPRWWVFETDRADCPLIPCRVRNECTGSKRDLDRRVRHWIFSEYLYVAGRVSPGSSFSVEVDLEHANPSARGRVDLPQWSEVRAVTSMSSEATVKLISSEMNGDQAVRVTLQVTPVSNASGLLYIPVLITTTTGSGVFDVIVSVRP